MNAVLVVAPRERERTRIARALRESGHQVIEARDEGEATAVLIAVPIALVIVAEETPPGPARDLVSGLRERTGGPLVVLGRERRLTEREALALGADHYERHPLHPDVLAARVGAYLRRLPRQDDGQYPPAAKRR